MTVSIRNLPEVVLRPDLDTSQFEVKFIEFWRMRAQKYNPSRRIDHNRTPFKELKASIAENGIVNAPVLTSDLVVIDAHRRREAGMELGLLGTKCRIAPFDSNDPRADILYKLLNTTEVMPGRQQLEVVFKGGPGTKARMNEMKAIKKSLGEDGYYINLFKQRGYVPQFWDNCKTTANLVFNNNVVKDRAAREALVHRATMKWQCADDGAQRQASLKRYCTKIRQGAPGYTVKNLWAAIEKNADLET